MKKLLLILLLFVSFTSIGQETKTFEETLTPYIEKIFEGIETGVEFAQQEIPIILKEYVMYEAIYSWFLILISFIILIIGIKLGKACHKKVIELNNINKSEGYLVARAFSYIIGIATFMFMFFINISTAIQATFFPKLFLVKEFLNYI